MEKSNFSFFPRNPVVFLLYWPVLIALVYMTFDSMTKYRAFSMDMIVPLAACTAGYMVGFWFYLLAGRVGLYLLKTLYQVIEILFLMVLRPLKLRS